MAVLTERALRGWGLARITALGEFHSPGRMAAAAVRLVVQIVLVTCLWRALYADTEVSAGLVREQAVTFAVLAVLATRIRELNRFAARDEVVQHIDFGTIVYWFLRPLPPRRYYFLRAVGDQLYGVAWAASGYVLCRLVGVVQPPVSSGAAIAFALSLLLGQIVFYYLILVIDLLCFWMLRNESALLILIFAQNLLSGAYAPLWYFPGWFRTVSAFLPFQATLNTPFSLYIGRIPLSAAPRELAVQLVWAVLLAFVSRQMWQRAGGRVVSQGG